MSELRDAQGRTPGHVLWEALWHEWPKWAERADEAVAARYEAAAQAVLAADPIRREALALVCDLGKRLFWLSEEPQDLELTARARALLAKAKGEPVNGE